MKNRLKPMGVGSILDNTFSILRERFWAFQGVNSLSLLPAMIFLGMILVIWYFMAGMNGVLERAGNFSEDIFLKNAVSLFFLMLLSFAYVIAYYIGIMYLTYGNIRLFSDGLHHRKTLFKDIFKGIRGKRWQFIGLCLMPLVIIFPVYFSLIAIAIHPVWGAILFAGSFIMYCIVLFWGSLSPVVIFLENQETIPAIKRAFRLMAKHRWRVFGIFLIVYLLWMVLFGGFYFFAVLAAVIFGLQHIVAYIGAGLFIVMDLLILNIILSYFYGPLTVIYYDLLIRKEGYDIQQQLAEEINSVQSIIDERGFGV